MEALCMVTCRVPEALGVGRRAPRERGKEAKRRGPWGDRRLVFILERHLFEVRCDWDLKEADPRHPPSQLTAGMRDHFHQSSELT